MRVKSLLVMLFFVVTGSFAQALSLRDVVLAEDLDIDYPLHTFPCSSYMGVVFCDRNLILEPVCAKSLKITEENLSCTLSSGERVIFARVLLQSRREDDTQGGRIFSYRLEYSPRVTLQTFTTPNGNLEYQVVIK